MVRAPVAVLGAGLMGHAVAFLFARGRFPVRLQDPNQSSLDSAPARIEAICTLLGCDAPAILARIECTRDLPGAVADCGLVIEAAPEILQVKQLVFAELDRHTNPDTILASNTSVIPIGAISEHLQHRSRILGAHFWNPPYVVPLVEVVAMQEENLPAANSLIATLKALSMRPVLVRRDIPGIIGNRLQHALKREAIALIASGVCDAETIDEVVKSGFGARMAVLGPLEQSDLVGLDLTKQIHDILMPDLDVTPRTHAYLAERVARGELGMKSGKGFRTWSPQAAQEVRDRLSHFLAQGAERNRGEH